MSVFTSSWLVELAIALVGLFGLLYWLATKDFNHWRKKGIKYEEPQAFFGNVKDMAFGKMSMGEALGKIYFQAKGLPYVGMFAFHQPVLLIRDLDIIKSVLVKDFSFFRDRNFGVDKKDSLFEKTLFGLSGKNWKSLRVKLTPTFTSGKMKLMYQFVNECATELVQYLEHTVPGDSGIIEVKDALARYTTDTIASCGFGLICNSLKDPNAEFRRMLKKVMEINVWKNIKFACTFFAPKILRLFHLTVIDEDVADFMRRVVWETVEERERTGYVRRDFLDLLMQLRKNGYVDSDAVAKGETVSNGTKNHSDENPSSLKYDLNGDALVAQAFGFINAGFETSSSTLTFCLYELACHPEHQKRLREEVREAMGREGGEGKLSYETLHGLTFMEQVVQETLRLYPILPFLDRKVIVDYHLPDSNILLEKDSVVMIPLLAIQRDPQYFEEPNSFRPERFSEENKKNIPPYSNMPFGEGPRICIGMRMGLMQVKVGLAHVINRFEFAPTSETAIPLQFDPTSFLLASKGGMPLKVTKLNDALV